MHSTIGQTATRSFTDFSLGLQHLLPLASTHPSLVMSSKVQGEGRDFLCISAAAFSEIFSKNGGRGGAAFPEGEHKILDKRAQVRELDGPV